MTEERARYSVHDPASNLRIGAYGDFNIELDRLALSPGGHVVSIVALDGLGNESTRHVEVDVLAGATWPLAYETEWQAGITGTAQIVDGLWRAEGDGIRTVETGYDRAIAIGDETWSGVDATVPITVHAIGSSTHSGFGVAAGWRGHEGNAWESPRTGWPLGAMCFYYSHEQGAWHQLSLLRYGSGMFVQSDPRANWIELGTTYMFRLRAEPVDSAESRYSCKVWRAADPEPVTWTLSALLPRRAGSLLLVADFADVTFGRVTVHDAAE